MKINLKSLIIFAFILLFSSISLGKVMAKTNDDKEFGVAIKYIEYDENNNVKNVNLEQAKKDKVDENVLKILEVTEAIAKDLEEEVRENTIAYINKVFEKFENDKYPVREIFEEIKFKVKWNESSKSIDITKYKTTVTLGNKEKYSYKIIDNKAYITKDIFVKILNDFGMDKKFLENTKSNHTSSIGYYGNYGGKGNHGWDKDPIDDLDAACQNHDRCYSWNGDNGSCNIRFLKSLDSILEYTDKYSEKWTYAQGMKINFYKAV